MTLVVEDGTVVAGAESYISVADASTYHAGRGNIAWAAIATDALREQALRRATDFMIQRYRQVWKGSRMDQSQVLDWPRGYVYLQPFIKGALYPYGTFPYMVPNNIVPDLVKRACAELALRTAVSGDLLADLSQGVVSESVGPIKTEYDRYSPQSKRYPAIDTMLAEFLTTRPGSARVVRA